MVCDSTDALFQGGRWWAQFLAPDHGPALETLFERCADYFELEFGLPPGPAEAQSAFIGLPEGKTYEDKLLIGIFEGHGNLIGVLDVIRDHPQTGEWNLALMLLDPSWRGQGMGREIYAAFERWATRLGARYISLAVTEQNQRARRFWLLQGFELVGRRPPKRLGAKESALVVMRRALSPLSPPEFGQHWD